MSMISVRLSPGCDKLRERGKATGKENGLCEPVRHLKNLSKRGPREGK